MDEDHILTAFISIDMGMPFAIIILDTGRNNFLCVVRLENDLTFLFRIWLIEMPIWNEKTLSTSRRIGLRNTLSPKQFMSSKSADTAECQLLHYPIDYTTHLQQTGVVIAFPFLPNPNMKGKDRRDQDDSDNSEERDGPPARYPRYAKYSQRHQTFTLWPHQRPTPKTISKAGFFYTGHGDLVRCYHCDFGMKNFNPDVDPLLIHSIHSPECNFLRQLTGEEVPKNILYSSDYVEVFKHQKNKKGRLTQYQTMEARVGSFNGFGSRARATIEEFANAGLYYTGFNDHVRCFACHGGLRDWDADDDPWFEHCRWFPTCPYAIEIRGREYITRVQEAENAHNNENIPHQLIQPDTKTQAMLSVYKTICLRMGYDESDIHSTVQELRNRGVAKPSLQEILDIIDIIKASRQQPTPQLENETPVDENRRLKSSRICMKCLKNYINALLLPCAHHKLCMFCAQPLESCPECGRQIQDKIQTYMG